MTAMMQLLIIICAFTVPITVITVGVVWQLDRRDKRVHAGKTADRSLKARQYDQEDMDKHNVHLGLQIKMAEQENKKEAIKLEREKLQLTAETPEHPEEIRIIDP